MSESLFAVIVNWNLTDDTIACVDSLFAAGIQSGQVIIVDNGSGDGSAQSFRERFGSSIQLIVSERNLGFAGGCNLGIKRALENKTEWVLLLNNDAYVPAEFIKVMEMAISSDNRFSIFGPIIFSNQAPNKIWYSGDCLVPGLLATYHFHHWRNDFTRCPGLVPVDFLSGCCMLIKRTVFDSIGLLDESFFMYGEDVDFCWRARVAGYRLAIATRAKMWHKVSASANQDAPTARYLRVRNQNRFYRANAHGLQIPAMIAFSALRASGMMLGDLIRGRWNLITPLARGWMDGWIYQEAATKSGNRRV